ncbi:MAG: ribonuclease III [Lachnospiraceae bacterium]|nr:ribonuclease III [Lachnospiraceae bacterium]
MHNTDIDKLQELIGYRFQKEELLLQAITHTSFDNEQKVNRVGNYERLEFLGDAILEAFSSEYLFQNCPKLNEGALTKARAALVCEPALAFCSRRLGINSFIRLGKGEENTGGRERDSIISDVMEAILGAIYLDGGMDPSRKYVENIILHPQQGEVMKKDNKSLLQEIIQGVIRKEFHYEMDALGEGTEILFKARVYLEEELIGEGEGRSKKAAQQEAAGNAVALLKEKGYVS